ncbi:Na+/H+ antiporter [Candidatus Mycobacterium wuenschmannii]|uniref:Na+/H+ antiporter n=1 Tax=Candidatus Mycobacterium wuenschmannii TaxID=3027808 RepID=A0ABY8VSV7_9MYCO|nr:Na+/H+ antiporter [Candidatus Mycobacterium wuenschmannii]WIM86718.1 Na+/H+ antiporter [Candidatus Mycobacterium wuenschmannii]
MIPATYTILLLCGPAIAIAAVWGAERIGVPFPVLLLGVGVFLSWFPWTPSPEIPPEIVFYLFLPPLVYYAALFVAPDDLRKYARIVVLLAVGLVLATAAAVAGVLIWLTSLSVVVAIVIGAIVAPTDTVSAISIFRRLDAPEGLSTIVEGEGLTNDGTALVLYVGAVDTAVAQVVHPGQLTITFLLGPVGGAALGFAIAWVMVRVRIRMHHPALEITISLATPYFTYAAADAAGMSGVLATAAAGLYVGARMSDLYSPGARLQALAFLDVFVFLLNAVLFILVGIQLHQQVHWALNKANLHLLLVLTAVVTAVIVMRLVFTLAGPALDRWRGRAVNADLWRERSVVGWAGMRGGVSLAAALAVPLHRADGSPFPGRDFVILTTAAVILATLVLQGVTLPWLVRRLGLKPDDFQTEENEARLHATHAALAWLDQRVHDGDSTDAAHSLHVLYEARARRLEAKARVAADASGAEPDIDQQRSYVALRLEALSIERSEVLNLRREGRITAAVLRALERGFDLEESRLNSR